METLTAREKEFIQIAANFLENPGFLIRATNALGKPLELLQRSLPTPFQKAISQAAEKALSKTLEISISTLPSETDHTFPKQPLLEGQKHTFIAAATGAVGGLFGPLSLAIELPITTGVIFRSIANIAQSFGEDLTDPEVRMQCLQVFAMGSPQSSADDAMNSAYFSQRLAFNAYLKRLQEKGGASLLSRLIARVASRYELVVTEKFMAGAIPLIGAAGGAAINSAFANYFNHTGYYHFGLRRLERKYGTELIQKVYLEAIGPHRRKA